MNRIDKTIRYSVGALIALLQTIMLTSCVDEIVSYMTLTPVRLSANAEEPQTRAKKTTGDVLDIQNTAFDEGAEIAVYIKDTEGNPIADGSGNPHWPAIFTAEEVNSTTHLNLLDHSPQLYYPTENKSVSIHAFYPKTIDAAEATGTDFKSSCTFSVLTDQTGVDNYKSSDLMFAKIDNQPRTAGNVNLNFAHKMVKFVFNVAGDGDVTINNCYLYQVNTKIDIDPTTGTLTELSGASADRQNVLLDNGGAVIIPPQTLSGTFIVVRGSAKKDGQPDLTDAEACFSLKVENGALTNRVLQSGKVYTVNLTVGYDNFGMTYEIGTWDEQAGVISIAAIGSTGFSIDNETISSEGYDYTGSEIVIPGLKVMYGSKELTENTHYDLQYFNNVHVGKATVLAIGKGAYEGYAVAASFSINQIASSLQYTETDKETDKESLSVEYAKNYTINPRATNPKDIYLNIVGNGTMEYSISRIPNDNTTVVDDVAIIDESTGIITLKGTGTVLVSATMHDDKDYTGSTDSFTLTVNPRSYSTDNSKIRAYFTDNGVNGGSPVYTYDGTQHRPAITVEDYIDGIWTSIEGSYSITWPDDVNAQTEARAEINLSEPYSGQIVLTYTINKATPNIRIYENGAQITSTTPLYLALPNSNTEASLSRTRIAATDFGTAVFTPNATNNIFDLNTSTAQGSPNSTSGRDMNTTGVFVAKGSTTGNVTYTVSVAQAENWNAASTSFTVYVIKSTFTYSYTGYTQRFVCPATGEYLLDVYGAQGGWANDKYVNASGNTVYRGGPGARVKGKIKLRKDEVLYVNVGQKGETITWDYKNVSSNKDLGYNAYLDNTVNTSNVTAPVEDNYVGQFPTELSENKVFVVGEAWNGGAGNVWGLPHHNTHSKAGWFCVRDPLSGGGGATDISLNWKNFDATTEDAAANKVWYTAEHLLTRIIVAGGGGGACYYSGESGSGNGASGGGGTQWAGFTTMEAVRDPGEGGKLFRGGFGGLAGGTVGNTYSAHNDDSYNETEYPRQPSPQVNGPTRGYGVDGHPSVGNCEDYTAYYDGRYSGWSGADGIFGAGGYYYCIEEGSGAGGGGWYGGGAAGQSGGNGPAGGGSSYAWTNTVTAGGHTLDFYYPTATKLSNMSTTATQDARAWNYMYKSTSVQTPYDRSYRYLYDVTSESDANEASSDSDSKNGSATITCLSTSNTVDLGTGRN